jgi:hypothetical protein
LDKLRLDCRAGVSPQTAKQQDELVLIELECQGQLKDSFVQKKQRKASILSYATSLELALRCQAGALLTVQCALFG